jgi:hypothetical protein
MICAKVAEIWNVCSVMRFEVLAVVNIKTVVFWNVTLRCLVHRYYPGTPPHISQDAFIIKLHSNVLHQTDLINLIIILCILQFIFKDVNRLSIIVQIIFERFWNCVIRDTNILFEVRCLTLLDMPDILRVVALLPSSCAPHHIVTCQHIVRQRLYKHPVIHAPIEQPGLWKCF